MQNLPITLKPLGLSSNRDFSKDNESFSRIFQKFLNSTAQTTKQIHVFYQSISNVNMHTTKHKLHRNYSTDPSAIISFDHTQKRILTSLTHNWTKIHLFHSFRTGKRAKILFIYMHQNMQKICRMTAFSAAISSSTTLDKRSAEMNNFLRGAVMQKHCNVSY